ncbi:MAG TPA: serine/threonine protein kinase [Phycisphaerales bacterium]|nr:serine/threonine protein kinase [Phycisphaerales bacterium]
MKIFRKHYINDEMPYSDTSMLFVDSPSDDDVLVADAIDEYASMMVAQSHSIDLEYFLTLIPNIRKRPVVLDTAIDIAINDLVRHNMSIQEATELLLHNYPDLAENISTASTLSALLNDPHDVDSILDHSPSLLEFGPIEEGGGHRYQLVEQCGSGSSGRTYVATDRRLTDDAGVTTVAIKMIRLHGIPTESRGVILAEANRAGSISHPNVVRVFDRGIAEENWAYVVMEYSSIGTMENWKPAGLPWLVRCIRDVARGLHAIHSAGIVHADLKPANILLYGNADLPNELVPKITDFGIAHVLDSDLDELVSPSGEGRKYGNLAFMAPEVFDGSASHSIQSDIYSLASMLRYMITGDLAKRSRVEPNTTDSNEPVLTKIPSRLDRILNYAMQADPALRPNSAAEFGDLLEAWLTNTSTPLDSSYVKVRLWSKRHPALAAAAASLILAAPPIGIGYVNAREGWAYRRGMEQARVDVLAWYRKAAPAFSNRASVYDLAGRFVVHKMIRDEDSLSWVFNDELTIDDRVRALRADLRHAAPNSLDELLFREQVILHQLQSKRLYPDTQQFIDTQAKELKRSGLLDSTELEQVRVLSAIASTKSAVINRSGNLASVSEGDYRRLLRFLESRQDPATGMLRAESKRDPRIRLASRAVEWLSSPKMYNDTKIHEWIQHEYRVRD